VVPRAEALTVVEIEDGTASRDRHHVIGLR
jgi:hypothetical protein